jgi:pentatricopeptide repeat protein
VICMRWLEIALADGVKIPTSEHAHTNASSFRRPQLAPQPEPIPPLPSPRPPRRMRVVRAHFAELHGRLVRAHLAPDPAVAGCLVALLAPHDARYVRTVLDRTRHPSTPVCNCVIRGHSSRGAPRTRWRVATFRAMLRRGVPPDGYTMAAVVSARPAFSGSSTGDAVHALVRKIGYAMDLFVMSGLVNLYDAARNVEDAMKDFEEMRKRDVVSWTSMISAFAQCGNWNDALSKLSGMREDGIKFNRVTIINLLYACALSTMAGGCMVRLLNLSLRLMCI